MMLHHQNRSESLSAWLDLATRSIEPSAQARIHTEIEAHYAQAVEFQMENGIPEPEAKARALADLGDAKAAGRRFRREHLTVREARRVADWLQDAQSGGTYAGRILVLCFLAFIAFFSGADEWYFPFWSSLMLVQFVLVSFTSYVAYVPAGRRISMKHQRMIILVESVGWLNAGVFLVAWVFIMMPPPYAETTTLAVSCIWGITTAFLGKSAWMSLSCLRVWRKLALTNTT